MARAVRSVSSLLAGMGILLSGSGLLGTTLGLRAGLESFGSFVLGVVMSGFFLGYIVGAWICAPLIRRVGHIRTFAACAATTAIVSLLYGLWVDPIAWWALRVVNGVGLIGIYMVIESWLNERAGNARARVFSFYMMVNLLAVAAGQYLIVLYGAQGIGSFAVVAILFCGGLIPIALTPVEQPGGIETHALSLTRLFVASPVGFAGACGTGLAIGSFWAFAAVYADDLGLEGADIANFIAAAVLGGALLQWPIGWLSDRGDRRPVLAGAASFAALALLAMWLTASSGPLAATLASFVFGSAAFSIYGLAVAQTHDRFGTGDSLEATKALLLLHGIGAVLGPPLTGAIVHASGLGTFPLVLAVMLVALAVFTAVRMRIDPPVPERDRGSFLPVSRTSTVAMDLDPRSEATGDRAPAEREPPV